MKIEVHTQGKVTLARLLPFKTLQRKRKGRKLVTYAVFFAKEKDLY